MKIAVIGIGHVGIPNAILLAKKYQVDLIDIDSNKVDAINKGLLPINDIKLEKELKNNKNNVCAKLLNDCDFCDYDYFMISISANFDNNINSINTSSIEQLIREIYDKNQEALIIIRSTVTVGFTSKLSSELKWQNIVFCPEFISENSGYEFLSKLDKLIIGLVNFNMEIPDNVKVFSDMYSALSNQKVEVIFMKSEEAESLKLFENAFLANRVAFFNEVDNFASEHKLDSKRIINALCKDSRIGNYYNNPSFGYGGYCLPKDVRQLISTCDALDFEYPLFNAIEKSNEERKINIGKTIAKKIEDMNLKDNGKIGVYRLQMKKSSDNFRDSAVIDIIKYLISNNIDVLVYEPLCLGERSNLNFEFVDDFNEFVSSCDLIIANRIDDKILIAKDKLFSRDIFNRD